MINGKKKPQRCEKEETEQDYTSRNGGLKRANLYESRKPEEEAKLGTLKGHREYVETHKLGQVAAWGSGGVKKRTVNRLSIEQLEDNRKWNGRRRSKTK